MAHVAKKPILLFIFQWELTSNGENSTEKSQDGGEQELAVIRATNLCLRGSRINGGALIKHFMQILPLLEDFH